MYYILYDFKALYSEGEMHLHHQQFICMAATLEHPIAKVEKEEIISTIAQDYQLREGIAAPTNTKLGHSNIYIYLFYFFLQS